MTHFSTAAQALLDAYGNEIGNTESVWHPCEFRGIAVILRAAASQLTNARSSDKLRAIADELESQ